MVTKYVPTKQLRSANSFQLVRTKPKLVSYGGKSFSYASQKLWNTLPIDIRRIDDIDNFKKCLKTHIFKQAY